MLAIDLQVEHIPNCLPWPVCFRVVACRHCCATCAAAVRHVLLLQVDEHDSLKLFSTDLEGMTFGDQAYEDKMHQLMEVRQL
jgi:hypothetical protein